MDDYVSTTTFAELPLSDELRKLKPEQRVEYVQKKAKEREELFVPDRPEPIVLPARSQGLFLVQRIRDEAHRFAVTYHQKLRARRAVRSVLDDVPGVGPARKRALLRRFGSVRAMADATPATLAEVPGVGPQLAEKIRQAIAD